MKNHSAFFRICFENLITSLLFILSAKLATIWSNPLTNISPLWAPSGVALALVQLFNYRNMVGIWLGGFLFELLQQGLALKFIWGGIFLGISETVHAALAAGLIFYFTHTKTPYYKLRDVVSFVAIAYLVSLSSASVGVSIIRLVGTYPVNYKMWLDWWLGDSAGILIFTPLIMIWTTTQIEFNWKKALELISLFLFLALGFLIIYRSTYPIQYIFIPFGVWAAVSFGPQVAIVVAFLISVSSVWLEMRGYGFPGQQIYESAIFLQGFICVVFFTTIVLSALLNERKMAQKALNKTLGELEERVHQRTQDLSQRNQELHDALAELKQAQVQLVQAEKMSSLGILTAGIAHEINNSINFVAANINPLKNDIDDILKILHQYNSVTPESVETLKDIKKSASEMDLPYTVEETHKLIEGIAEGAKRTATIVKDLRTFSRLDEGELKTVNIHENIDSTLNLLRNQYKTHIQIIKNYGDIPPVECFPDKLNQVFMNILINAIHAIPDKGEVTITTKKESENKISISFQDTGSGMSKEVMDKIFLPFFTTKKVGVGTGLGLSISYSIIQDHHGSIEVKSELGKGTVFIIYLPVVFIKP